MQLPVCLSPHSLSCLLQYIRSFHAIVHPIIAVLISLFNTQKEKSASLYTELVRQLGLVQP